MCQDVGTLHVPGDTLDHLDHMIKTLVDGVNAYNNLHSGRLILECYLSYKGIMKPKHCDHVGAIARCFIDGHRYAISGTKNAVCCRLRISAIHHITMFRDTYSSKSNCFLSCPTL